MRAILCVISIKSRVKGHLRLYLAYISDGEPTDEEQEEEEEEIQAVEEVSGWEGK